MAVLSRFLQFSLGLSAILAINANPLGRRAEISSDSIVGFLEKVPSGETGVVYEAYQPYLYVVNGCVPFPGVDAEGNTKYSPSPLQALRICYLTLTVPV
jgi:hypothetical protein